MTAFETLPWGDFDFLPNDDEYLNYYNVTFCNDLESRELMYISAVIGCVPFYRLDLDTTFRPFKAAILALASLARHGRRNYDTNSYYNFYLKGASALKAIANDNLTSLMYASYVMAILHCLYETSTKLVLVHCAQFCRLVDVIFHGDLS